MGSLQHLKRGRDLPRRAAIRFVTSSRACFDADLRGANVATSRLEALSAALEGAVAEATALRAELVALQATKAWRITAPLRYVMSKLRRPTSNEPPVPVVEPPPYVPLDYAEWIRTQEPHLKRRLREDFPGHGKVWAPRLALVILPGGASTPEPVDGCALLHAGLADAFDVALSADADFVGFFDPRDRLAPDALAIMREALARAPQTSLVFSDEDWLDETGARCMPFFKPGWDEELARGRDLVGPFTFFSVSALRQAKRCADAAWRLDLAYQVAALAGPDQILHIPAVLCHRAAAPAPAAAALQANLVRLGVAATLDDLKDTADLHRVVYHTPIEPLVSIVICTRDRADLLKSCMDGILHNTDYRRFEVIIVDNGSAAPDALTLLETLSEDSRITVLRDVGSFNWARLNNLAAAHAVGDILLLLNNDIEVRDGRWLHELVAQTIQPGIGAVGVKLLYPDGRVQHAGLSVDGHGVPTHIFRLVATDAPGVSSLMRLTREVWAVTGACLAVPRAVFEESGGLNEALPVAANDVEFCLRLGALGYRIVYTPWAVLVHHEQATRLPDDTDEKRARARGELNRVLRDWSALALHDPYLNPNLMLIMEQPVLRALAPAAA